MSNNNDTLYKKLIAQNRRARFEYEIEDKFEVGIVLQGSEVKSLRAGKVSIAEAFADINGDEVFLYNMSISHYKEANRWNHLEKRPRKLLLHKQQIRKLIGKLKIKGLTLIPLNLYFNDKSLVKLELALAKGKKLYDKRESEKKRDWQRQKARLEK